MSPLGWFFLIVTAGLTTEALKRGFDHLSEHVLGSFYRWRRCYRLRHGWEIRSSRWVKPRKR